MNNILYNRFLVRIFFVVVSNTNHLPDPTCENSFRLNVTNLILRQSDNSIARMNYCTI